MKKIIIGLLLACITATSFSQGIKISAFPTATGKAESGWLPVVQGGVTKKIRTDSIAQQAKHYADSILAVSEVGKVVTVKVTLSSAELLAAGTTPKVLIVAPGAGKIIRPIGFTFRLNYGTTTYTGGALRVYYSSGGSYLVSNSSYTNSSSILFYGAISTTVALTTGAVNDSLILDAASAVSVGDGTLDVYITYSVITL